MPSRSIVVAAVAGLAAGLAIALAVALSLGPPDRSANRTSSTSEIAPPPSPTERRTAAPPPTLDVNAADGGSKNSTKSGGDTSKNDDDGKESGKKDVDSDAGKKSGKDDIDTTPGAEARAMPGQARLPDAAEVQCPEPTKEVRSSKELEQALVKAAPGDVIRLANGVYRGRFVAEASGTPQERIFLCGGRGAVLDGGGIQSGYVLHLNQAKYWAVIGFTVRNGQKGVMADSTQGSIIQSLTVTGIGDEAIHLRRNSVDNVVLGNTISNTGLRRPKFGEGIYIGSAESNWCTMTDCLPDRSDRNVIRGNNISSTTSESIDVKEGTIHGLILENTFDGAAISAADSWVDVKGTAWTISGNRGRNSPKDGFQTHDILDGWGTRNLFTNNTAIVNGPGFGYSLRAPLENIVECSNTAEGAASGLTNIECR